MTPAQWIGIAVAVLIAVAAIAAVRGEAKRRDDDDWWDDGFI